MVPLTSLAPSLDIALSHVRVHSYWLRQYQFFSTPGTSLSKILLFPSEIVHKESGSNQVVNLGEFVHTLLVLHVMFKMLICHYIGIPTSYISVFKLGRVFALFPRLMQQRLAKLIVIIVYFNSALPTGSVWGLESCEKLWIWLDQIQGLEILEFYKVVLKSLEFNCGQ